jgi:hypothetical protein
VKGVIEALPSLPKPTQAPKPVKRLLKAAQAFSQDGLVSDANHKAHSKLFSVLDGLAAQYQDQITEQSAAIMTAEIRRFTARRQVGITEERDSRGADTNTVKDALKHTRRVLSASLVNGYLRRELEQAVTDDMSAAPVKEVQARVAALSRIDTEPGGPSVVEAVENAADLLVRSWLSSKRDEIALLPESRQAAYKEIRELAREPEISPTKIKDDVRVDTVDLDGEPLCVVRKHIQSDADGEFPLDPKHNPDEVCVIKRETAKETLVGWYRNPDQATENAVRIAYQQDGRWHSMQPDFIFVQRNTNGELKPSIVDPHGHHHPDAMAKLLAMADYAERYGSAFARIESLASVDDELRTLDMKDASVRDAVIRASVEGENVKSLFYGPFSAPY